MIVIVIVIVIAAQFKNIYCFVSFREAFCNRSLRTPCLQCHSNWRCDGHAEEWSKMGWQPNTEYYVFLHAANPSLDWRYCNLQVCTGGESATYYNFLLHISRSSNLCKSCVDWVKLWARISTFTYAFLGFFWVDLGVAGETWCLEKLNFF